MDHPTTPAPGPEAQPPLNPGDATPGAPPTASYATPVQPVAAYTMPVVAPPRRRLSILNVLLVVALLVAFGGVAFAVGRISAPPSTAASGLSRFAGTGTGTEGAGFTGRGGFGGGAGGLLGSGGGLTVEGTVTKITGNQLTLHLADGSDIQISLDGSTTYHRQGSATQSDVTVGGQVQVELNGFRGNGGANAGNTGGAGARPSFNAGARPSFNAGSVDLGPARDITIVSQ